eukprot:2138010-Pleurochrysis_carterae.AAC.1
MRALVHFRRPSRACATSCSVTAVRACALHSRQSAWLHAQSRVSRERAPTPCALPSHAAGRA